MTSGPDPIVHPVLGALSPSRAGDFMTCPLLYRFRAIDRFPERPGPAAARGTLVHAVLERLFDLPAARRTLPEARGLVEPVWRELAAAQPELRLALLPEAESAPADDGGDGELADGQAPVAEVDPEVLATWLSGAADLLDTYFRLEDPTRLEPAARELRLEVAVDGDLPLRGIVDRIDVAPDGMVRVVDYKTGRSPGAGFEQRALFQMRFYALMHWRISGTIPRRLQLLYLGDGQTLHYEPDEADLLAFQRTLRALWTTMNQVAATGSWQPKRSRLCDWCDHHRRCPEQGGELPELPEHARPVPVDLRAAVSVQS